MSLSLQKVLAGDKTGQTIKTTRQWEPAQGEHQIKDLGFLLKPIVLFGLKVATIKLGKRVNDRAQRQVNKRPEFWLKN